MSEYKHDRISTSEESRSGRPKTASNNEMVYKIYDVVLVDRRSKLIEMAEITGISEELVGYTLYEILGMKNLMFRWVPHLPTPEQK